MKSHLSRAMAVSLLSGLAVSSLAHSVFARPPEYTVIAETGGPAPGTGDGVVFASLHTPSINPNGRVAFLGGIQGPGVVYEDNAGIWTGTTGNLSLAVRKGDPAPQAGAGLVFDILFNVSHPALTAPLLDDDGRLGFVASLAGPNVTYNNGHSIWLWVSSGLTLVARAEDPAPGMPPGVLFGHLVNVSPVLNDGRIAFRAFIWGPGVTNENDLTIWSGIPGALELQAREGDPSQGGSVGDTFDDLYFDPTLNDGGQLAFCGRVSLTSWPWYTEAAWAGGPGNVSLILQETDPLPIAGDGVTVASVSTSIPQSATGEIALPVLVEGPGITSTNDAMLLRVSTAGISVIAREGDAAPGLADGVVFNGYFGSPVLNHHGDVVFFAGLSGPGVTNENYYGLWRAGAYGLQLILRMGDPPPGVNPPATIHDFIDLAMAENGCVAFRALVMTGPGDNRPGIWATDPCGGLYLIALKGEPLQIAPGDVRVVADLEIAMSAGPSDGRPRSINDDSAVVFSAAFADQSDAILMARLGDACLADTNCDGSVNGGDVPMFVACIVSPSFGCARADLNGDGVSSLQDVSPFVDELIESPDCP